MASGGTGLGSARNPTFRCIAASRRREALRVLLDRDAPMTDGELAPVLVGTERGNPTAGETPDAEAVRTELVHVHLPALSDAGLVEWNRTAGIVETTAHPALGDPRFRQLLDVEIDGFDEALSGLAHERRRIVLTYLRNEGTPRSRSDLTRELSRLETGATEPNTAAIESIVVSLHHAHLPKLADSGLVEYDPDTGRVAYAGHPALERTFRIIYEPDEYLVERFDGFLSGLETSYRQAGRDADEPAGWPHFWRDPHHG